MNTNTTYPIMLVNDLALATIATSADRERETKTAITRLVGDLLLIHDRDRELSRAIDQLQDAYQDMETAFFRARRAVMRVQRHLHPDEEDGAG